MSKRIIVIGHNHRSIGLALALEALKGEGHDVTLIDADTYKQMQGSPSTMTVRAPLPTELIEFDNQIPEIQLTKPHEIKYPVTRKSKFNQKKRRK